MKEKISMPKCFICMDEGFILYRKKVRELEGEYIAHCVCQAGEQYSYDGTRCEKKKSPYYIPSIAAELDHESIAAENLRNWIKQNKDKEGFLEAMERLGLEVPQIDKTL